MKLLTRTNLHYIFFSLITYVIIAGSFYLVVEYVIYRDVEERLVVERKDFEHFVESQSSWNENFSFVEGKIFVQRVNDTMTTFLPFKDTLLYNRYNNQLVPFREHSFYCSVGPNLYKVSIRKSMIESNRLLKFIMTTMLIVLSAGMTLLFLFQRRISKTIWKPFYETLSRAKAFEVTQGKELQLPEQQIFEFNELNNELNKMTAKISSDYMNLKEFTENASHEIQTPLALINSRVEEIIQEKGLSLRHMDSIKDIHDSAMRLSKLNQALLLLSKIENGQFHGQTPVSIQDLVTSKIRELEDIVSILELTIKFEKPVDFYMDMNSTLADILVTNLVSNAIKHNQPKGWIKIITEKSKLIVENTGKPLTIPPEQLFERFKKQNKFSNSLGLGLAIVKRICEVYHLGITYEYHEGKHRITVAKPYGLF
jgi:signal transduction histidine kinase